MKSYSQIVNKHFKVNKRRNISTIIGITVSIILFIVVGYMSNYIGEVDVVGVIEESGNYEAIFKELDKAEVDKVIHNVKVQSYGLYCLEYEKAIDSGVLNQKFQIYALDNNSINNIFKPLIKLKEGNLPANAGELALDYSSKEYFDKSIGDKLEFNNKVYNIVGFYEEDTENAGMNLSAITFFDINYIKNNINVSVNIKGKGNKINDIDSIRKVLNIENVEDVLINKRLFYAYGINTGKYGSVNSNKMTALIVIDIVILLLTILFTYGSINVSLKERVRDFAALRCIGATPNKIRYLLIKESIILGALTIIPGIVLGQILCWLLSEVIFAKIIGINNYGLGLRFYGGVIMTAVIFVAVTIILATIIPIIKASKITPIQGVKSEIKPEANVKWRSSKLINKIFGYKGNLAYKNISANNKSFIVITISLTALLVIFVTFSWYYSFLLKEYNRGIEKSFDIAADYEPYAMVLKEEIDGLELLKIAKDLEADISALGHTKELYKNITIRQDMNIKGMEINPKLTAGNYVAEDLYKNKDTIEVTDGVLIAYDDASINKILPHIKSSTGKEVTLEEFKNNGFIILNTAYGKKVTPIIPGKAEKVQLYLNKEKDNAIEVNYLGSIEHQNLISANRYGYYNDLAIIVSQDFIRNNSELIEGIRTLSSSVKINMNISATTDRTIAKTELEREVRLKYGYFINEKENLEEDKNFYHAMAVMIYTTLVLAMVVGAINIINTRSVNIMLRKKEFGTMLAVGMSKENLKKLIILEGIVQWFISAILGTILSIIIVIVLNYMLILSNDTIMYGLPYATILLGAIILLIINLLSSILPYKRFNKGEVTELMRNEE